MSERIKKVAIVTNFNIYEKLACAMKVAERLDKLGCEIIASVYNKDKLQRQNKYGYNIKYASAEEIYSTSELVVVIGGDGTILESSRRAAPYKVPVLGINMGRVGYLAELEMNELDLLDKVIEGIYNIEVRSMLSVEIVGTNGNIRSTGFALNDAVISNGSISRIVDLELYEGDVLVSSYRSDGIIIATPTGSTAYSMSAGGAIVDPRLSCICVTPICPHSLSAKPIIFPETANISIKNVCQREKMLFLTVDGRMNMELYKGDTVKIHHSDMSVRLVSVKQSGFYSKLRKKMNENK